MTIIIWAKAKLGPAGIIYTHSSVDGGTLVAVELPENCGIIASREVLDPEAPGHVIDDRVPTIKMDRELTAAEVDRLRNFRGSVGKIVNADADPVRHRLAPSPFDAAETAAIRAMLMTQGVRDARLDSLAQSVETLTNLIPSVSEQRAHVEAHKEIEQRLEAVIPSADLGAPTRTAVLSRDPIQRAVDVALADGVARGTIEHIHSPIALLRALASRYVARQTYGSADCAHLAAGMSHAADILEGGAARDTAATGQPCERPCGSPACGASGRWCQKGPAR